MGKNRGVELGSGKRIYIDKWIGKRVSKLQDLGKWSHKIGVRQ